MTVVLDTSAAFEIAFNRPNAPYYKEILQQADKVLAPLLYDSEVTNVLWKYVKADYIDEQNAQATLVYLLQIVDAYTDCSDLDIEALHEAIRLNHSVYDMYLFVLARRNGAMLLTQDAKLKALCIANGVSVR
ncbi:MAG: type II toxin-antitoxin system VapC family toxin [Treponema sp.]|nr:type II toxin-antitoxin system VapC family toxin [Candidatus Treponema equifaecale]